MIVCEKDCENMNHKKKLENEFVILFCYYYSSIHSENEWNAKQDGCKQDAG